MFVIVKKRRKKKPVPGLPYCSEISTALNFTVWLKHKLHCLPWDDIAPSTAEDNEQSEYCLQRYCWHCDVTSIMNAAREAEIRINLQVYVLHEQLHMCFNLSRLLVSFFFFFLGWLLLCYYNDVWLVGKVASGILCVWEKKWEVKIVGERTTEPELDEQKECVCVYRVRASCLSWGLTGVRCEVTAL